MIPVSDALVEALQGGSFRTEYVADLVVDGDVKVTDLPLSACELTADTGSKVVTRGSATVTYTDELGSSIVPTDLQSWLTPFASFLDVSYRVAVGDQFSEKVLRGRLKVTGVSDSESRGVRREGRVLTVGSRVQVRLADLMHVTDREDFIAPTGPKTLGSARTELARITGFPVVTAGADAVIPRSVTYEENRMDAVVDLASVLNAYPYMAPSGGLALAPKGWGDPVGTLRVGSEGSIVRADPDEMSDDDVYNQVVVRSHEADQSTILATAEVEQGPLRYGGPFGRVPYFASSQYVTTADQARKYALSLLPQVSDLPAVQYTIQCLPDPRFEVWDVVVVKTQDREFRARITKIVLPGSGLMTLTVQVAS